MERFVIPIKQKARFLSLSLRRPRSPRSVICQQTHPLAESLGADRHDGIGSVASPGAAEKFAGPPTELRA